MAIFTIKSPVTQFILKALGIFILWYVVYELWLLPDGRLDAWVAHNIIGVSAGIVRAMDYTVFTYDRVVGIYYNAGIEIVDKLLEQVIHVDVRREPHRVVLPPRLELLD